jgi:flagellar motor switch protein FliM
MAPILSPAEIDALLSAAPDAARGARAAAPPVRPYDFRRPDRVSPEQVRALEVLHERAARSLSTSFSASLRTSVVWSVTSIEQSTYAAFLASAADPTAFYALGLAPFDDLGALDVNGHLAFALIDRLLGGRGSAVVPARPLTEIEQHVMDSVVKLLLEGLTEAWKPVTNLAFSIRARDTRPQMLQVAAPNEIVVVVVLTLQIGDVSGLVSLSLPASVVEAASAQFAPHWPRHRRESSTDERAWLAENLGRVRVPVVPVIRTTASARTVLGLAPGDVLTLPLAADRPIDVDAGGVKKLTGRLAADQGRLLVMVEARMGRSLPVPAEKVETDG